MGTILAVFGQNMKINSSPYLLKSRIFRDKMSHSSYFMPFVTMREYAHQMSLKATKLMDMTIIPRTIPRIVVCAFP